jgi:small conductance mechanosensitive channel
MDNLPPTLQTALTEFLLFLPDIITSIVVFIVTIVAAGFLRNLVERALKAREADPQVSNLVASLVRWSILTAGTITALSIVHFDVTAFVTGLGVLGFAAGFALQETLANFVAGILILIQQPFRTGDLVDIGGFFGDVTAVDLRATRLVTPEGQDVLIPNSTVLGNAITNWTLSPDLRIGVDVGVAYDSDLDRVEQVALAAVVDLPGLLDTHDSPFVWFHAFGDSSIDLTVHFWVDTGVIHRNEAKDEALKRIKKAFNENGISIPFPIRTVYMEK